MAAPKRKQMRILEQKEKRGWGEKKTATNNNKQWQIFGKLASKTLQNIKSLQ
jgi:hypothetical protein